MTIKQKRVKSLFGNCIKAKVRFTEEGYLYVKFENYSREI